MSNATHSPAQAWPAALLALLLSPLAADSARAEDDLGLTDTHSSFHRHWADARPATHDPASAPALPRVEGDFTLDAKLDEPFWSEALVWELAYERQVELNGPARQRTLFFAALADGELRLAFLCLDDQLHRLRAHLTDRLSEGPEGDYVWVGLGPLGDDRSIYFLYVNPRNVQADSFYEDGKPEDHSFDLPWQSATAIGEGAWTVEIRVPLRTLRYAAGAGTWRLAAARRQTREFSYFFWPLRWDPNRNCVVCQYPAVRVEPPAARRQSLQVTPYLAAFQEERAGLDDDDQQGGLDLKWQPLPNWIFDATLNPDFSQVESDDFQLTSNLRFAPFVPERRPFFVERSDLFTTPVQVAYTRSILDPAGGLRATGKVGDSTLALLAASDRATLLTFPGAFGSRSTVLDGVESLGTLASVRQDIGAAKLGVLATNRSYDGGYNRLISLDGKLPLGKTWNLELQGIFSRTAYPDEIAAAYGQPEGDFDGSGAWAQLSHYGRSWTHRWRLAALDEGLRADLGFLPQVDYQRLTVTEWYHHWVEGERLRDWGVFVEAFYTRHDGETRDWEVWLGGDMTVLGETYLDLGWIQGQDTVSHGLLDYGRLHFIFRSKPTRWFSVSGTFSHGRGIDYALEVPADYTSLNLTPVFRLFDRLTISINTRWQQLVDGSTLQDQLVSNARLDLQLTSRVGFRQIWQTNRASFPDARYRELGLPPERRVDELQSLLRYRLDYASALFLGYYQRHEEEPRRQRDRGLFLKASYQWNH